MITSLPEVIRTALSPEDEFMVLACDGIWNSLTSQQVVDFVRDRIAEGIPLDDICAEMTREILAEDLSQPGTDNMTIVIVQFQRSNQEGKTALGKRGRDVISPRSMRPRKMLRVGHSSSS